MPGDNPKLNEYLNSLLHVVGYYQLEKAPGINDKSALGDSPLHIAIWQNDHDSALLLIEHGADINAIGEDGYTPLHVAACQDDIRFVETLIRAGASADAKEDMLGRYPEDIARNKGLVAAAQILSDARASSEKSI